ncbi:MAG TPA: lysophospholipase [Polyangiaceae bacterium]|nr:lysophospholipase [Polyangiaceae bacterium]
MNEATFENVQGLKLFFRSWRPAGPPRAAIIIVPGFNSHSGYYQWAAERLVEAGFATYSLDLRGRGRSAGERFYVEHFSDYVSDVASFAALVRLQEPSLPLYVFGHSAGGVVACLYTLEHQSELAGLICESFAFQVPAPDVALSILKGLSHVAPHAHVLKLKNADFSRDPGAVAKMDADPLIAGESQASLTVAEMVRADERLEQAFPRFSLPLLILHGTADKATKASGSQLFFERAGTADKTLKLYEGHYHDLLADLGKELVMGDILSWLTMHAAAASAKQGATSAFAQA